MSYTIIVEQISAC